MVLSGFFYGLLSNQVWEAYRIIMERAPKPPHAKFAGCSTLRKGVYVCDAVRRFLTHALNTKPFNRLCAWV